VQFHILQLFRVPKNSVVRNICIANKLLNPTLDFRKVLLYWYRKRRQTPRTDKHELELPWKFLQWHKGYNVHKRTTKIPFQESIFKAEVPPDLQDKHF
jgi:hypothetical protein